MQNAEYVITKIDIYFRLLNEKLAMHVIVAVLVDDLARYTLNF